MAIHCRLICNILLCIYTILYTHYREKFVREINMKRTKFRESYTNGFLTTFYDYCNVSISFNHIDKINRVWYRFFFTVIAELNGFIYSFG